MITRFLGTLKRYWAIALVVLGLLAVGYVGYGCGKRTASGKIADLTTRLVTSEQTVEVEKGLYAKKSAEVDDLKDLVSKLGEDNQTLQKLIDDGKMEVIALNELVIKWKKAYKAAVDAHQGEEPPETPGDPPRKRVDFQGPVGPFVVKGHTLTDPAQAWLEIDQVMPLRLKIALTKNRDGTYSTLVDSGTTEVDVDIKVSAIDPKVFDPKWYQRLWLELGADFYGDKAGRVGLSYRWSRWSLGASCTLGQDTSGCGATVGYRIFK